jgi:hypothetical protein
MRQHANLGKFGHPVRSAGDAACRALAAMAALLIVSATGQANPPTGIDGRYSAWFSELKLKDGTSCCDIADCRFVSERIVGGQYEVQFHDADPAFPRQWVAVPDDAVLPRPPGGPASAVACWFQNRIFCFFGEPES